MSIGRQIKLLRKELGLSVGYIAETLNISSATLYRYENGDIGKIPGNILEPLAQILKTSPAHLMGWNNSEHLVLSNEEQNIIKQYRNKPELQQAIKLLLEVK